MVGVVGVVAVLAVGGLALLGARGLDAQRERQDDQALRTALREAAVAMETYGVDHLGAYTTSLDDLVALGGYRPDPAVDVEIVRADTADGGEGYCLVARPVGGGSPSWLASVDGSFSEAPCE